MVTVALGAEAGASSVNVWLLEPAGTVTLAGTTAALGFELVSATTTPPAGAAAEILTVPVMLLPRMIDWFGNDSEVSAGAGGGGVACGFTVSAAVRLVLPVVAVRLTTVVACGAVVVMGNETAVVPDVTVALAGTLTT